MAVYLMNRFKTQVSPRAVPFPLLLLSIYTNEIMCNTNCSVLIKHGDNMTQEACVQKNKFHCWLVTGI